MTPHTHRILVRVTVIALAALVLAYGLLWLLLPLVPTETIRSQIVASVEQHTDYHLRLGKMYLRPTVFHGMKAILEDPVLTEHSGNVLAEADQMDINFSYIPLLHHKVWLTRMVLQEPVASVFPNSFPLHIHLTQDKIKQVEVKDMTVILNHYRLIYQDTMAYEFQGPQLIINHIQSKQPYTLRGRGELATVLHNVKSPIMVMRIDGSLPQNRLPNMQTVRHMNWLTLYPNIDLFIEDLSLDNLDNGLEPFVGWNVDAHGVIEQMTLRLKARSDHYLVQFSANTHDALHVIINHNTLQLKPGLMSFRAKLPYSFPQHKGTVQDLFFRLKSRQFEFLANGEVFLKPHLEQSRLDVYTSSSWLPFKTLLDQITQWHIGLPPAVAQWLNRVDGEWGTQMHFLGPLNHPIVQTDFLLRHVTLYDSAWKTRELAHDISGRIFIPSLLAPKLIQLDPLQGKVDQTHILLRGSFTQQDMHLMAQIRQLDLSRLKELLRRVNVMEEPLNRFMLGGMIQQANIYLNGPMHQPNVAGTVLFSRVAITHTFTRTLLARDLQGFVSFDSNRHFAFRRVQGVVADSSFQLDGHLNFIQQTMALRVWAANLDLAKFNSLLRLMGISHFDRVDMQGHTALNLALAGKMSSPMARGQVVLNRVGMMAIQPHAPVFNNLSGRLVFLGDGVQLEKIVANIGTRPVQLSGLYQFKNQWLNMQIGASKLNLADLQQTLLGLSAIFDERSLGLWTMKLAGLADVQVHLMGPAKQLNASGQLLLQDASYINTHAGIALQHITGRILFTQQQLVLNKLHGWFQGSPFLVSGTIHQKTGQLNLLVTASNMVLKPWEDLLNPRIAKNIGGPITLGGRADAQVQVLGNISKPVMAGKVIAHNSELSFPLRGIRTAFTNINGTVLMVANRFHFMNMTALMKGVPVRFAGDANQLNYQDFHLQFSAQNVPLQMLKETAIAYLDPPIQAILAPWSVVYGRADFKLLLNSGKPIDGEVVAHNAAVLHPLFTEPFVVSRGRYDIGAFTLEVPNGAASIVGVPVNVSGKRAGNQYLVDFSTAMTPVSVIRDHRAFFAHLIPLPIPTMYNTTGNFRVVGQLLGATTKVAIEAADAGASMAELKFPVYNMNGSMEVTVSPQGFQAASDNLHFRYANSPMEVDMNLHNLKDMFVEVNGTASPLLVNQVFNQYSQGMVAYAAVPFNVDLSGSLGQLSGKGTGNDLYSFLNFNVASLFSEPQLERPATIERSALEQATLSSVVHLLGDSLSIEKTRIRINDTSSVVVQGQIDNLFTPKQRHSMVSVMTEPVLDLEALGKRLGNTFSEGLGGQIIANLMLEFGNGVSNAKGQVEFKDVHSKALEIDDLDGTVQLAGKQGTINLDHVQIPGVDLQAKGKTDNLFTYPVPLTDVSLAGPQIIVPLFGQWMDEVIEQRLHQGIWQTFFPSTSSQKGSPLPFEVVNGQVDADELIISNLIIQNFHGPFRLYANTFFEIPNFTAESAGGTATGNLSMNPNDNRFTAVHVNIENMKANAVTQIFFNISNEIFGNLSGTIDYTTEGMTQDEVLSNVNGTANLVIEDGRLPSIARIENLLIAANTISGGLINFNLNSLFHLAAPFETNYFAVLTGEFRMADGIVYIDKMVSDGEDLDLFINGWARLVDGTGNLEVRGEMDRQISGIFGPLGELSIGRFLGVFPPLRTIISHIPGIGFIPGFGGPRSGKSGVAFEVDVVGPLNDPGSVQNFHWVQ